MSQILLTQCARWWFVTRWPGCSDRRRSPSRYAAPEVASLRIVDEIEPGIPRNCGRPGGWFAGSNQSRGFGSPGAMIAARQWLHDKTHD